LCRTAITKKNEGVMVEKVLSHSVFMEGLTEEQLRLIDSLIEEVHYQQNDLIFQQGERTRYLYFVVDGRVAIRFNPEDGPVLTVSEISSGDVFGWSAALGTTCYTSSAVCLEEGSFLRLEGTDLKKLCQEHPETGILILNRLAGVIAQRLRGTHEKVVAMLHQGLNHDQ
jgi:CRP/FNR family transcriptional regulator, cyclic AMP receptor protein